MSHSLNEIEALSKRAARGAGLSWGMAEEAGKAVRWLMSHRLPGVALLAGVLTQNDGQPYAEHAPITSQGVWQAPSGTLCPLASGATLNDSVDQLSGGGAIELRRVSHPMLMVPFAAWAASHLVVPIAVEWQNVRFTTDGVRLWIDDPKGQASDATATPMRVALADPCSDAAQMPILRGSVCVGCWEQLNTMAHRTYAPATEASRQLGAGAGVSDND
jgi:hypothetical protein